jgi:hypothetical protein
VEAVPTKAQVLQSIKDFLTAEFTHSKPRHCQRCGLSIQFVDASFALPGSAMSWKVSLPFCPVCDWEILKDVPQAETIH